jgi:hypothetical protein
MSPSTYFGDARLWAPTAIRIATAADSTLAAPSALWFSISSTNPGVYLLPNPAGVLPGPPQIGMNQGSDGWPRLWAQLQTVAPELIDSFTAGGVFYPTANASFKLVARAPVKLGSTENPRADAEALPDPDSRLQVIVDAARPQTVTSEAGLLTYPDSSTNKLAGILAPPSSTALRAIGR